MTVALSVAAASHFIPLKWLNTARDRFDAAPAPIQSAILVAAILVVQSLARTEVAPFIYFQF